MSKVLYSTKFLELKSTKSSSGNDWAYAHRPNAKNVVVIVPIIHDKDGDKIVFIETKRPPLLAENKSISNIELPAGLVGDENANETISEALAKELLEETGYKATNFEIVAKNVSSSAGCTSETSLFAIADIEKDLQVLTPVTDGGIIIAIHKIPMNNVKTWLNEQENQGISIGSQTLSGLFYAFTR